MTERLRGRSRSLSDVVVDELVERINAGRYAVGSRLPTEPEMIAEFNVSRTVIREALSRLKARNRVETRHGVGTFVLPVGVREFELGAQVIIPSTLLDVLAVLEARVGLEVEAAGMAALRRSDEQLLAIEAAMREFRHAVSLPEQDTVDPDIHFHEAIADATGNRFIREMLGRLGQAAIPRTRSNTEKHLPRSSAAFLSQVLDEHQAILDAIRIRDKAAACEAMRHHLAQSVLRLQSVRSEMERSDG
ncbi:FadR/GntR family transcriptional regulator [Frateuria aurantia]